MKEVMSEFNIVNESMNFNMVGIELLGQLKNNNNTTVTIKCSDEMVFWWWRGGKSGLMSIHSVERSEVVPPFAAPRTLD